MTSRRSRYLAHRFPPAIISHAVSTAYGDMTTGICNAVVEVPKGFVVKYELDKKDETH